MAFSASDDTVGKFLFNIVHDTGMVTMPAIGKKPLHEQLGMIVKDHNNACVQVKLFLYPSCVVKLMLYYLIHLKIREICS